jgi:hypothetical protein
MTRISELGKMLAITGSVLQGLVTANVVPSSPILVTVTVEAIRSSETSVLTAATCHNIPEDGSLQNYCHENLILKFSTYLNAKQYTKSRKPVILSVIHHHQNPVGSAQDRANDLLNIN